MMQWHLSVVAPAAGRACVLELFPAFFMSVYGRERARGRVFLPRKLQRGIRRRGTQKKTSFSERERKKGRVRKPGERGAVHSDGAQEQSNFIRVDLDAEGGHSDV